MLPSQLVDNLPEGLSRSDIEAGALVRRGLSAPIGETAIVRCGGKWIALVRESIFGPFSAVALAPDRRPRLEGEGFDEALVVETAAGEVHRLRISGFEREDLIQLLGPGAASSQAPAEPVPRFVAPLPFEATPNLVAPPSLVAPRRPEVPPPPQLDLPPPPAAQSTPPTKPTPQPDFAFSTPGPVSVDSLRVRSGGHEHQPPHQHQQPHEHSGSEVLSTGRNDLIAVEESPAVEGSADPRATLGDDVRRIAGQQGVNFAVMHYSEVAGVNLHEANARVKHLLGKGKKKKKKRGGSPQTRQVEATVLDLLRAKKKTAAILLYRRAHKVDVPKAREAVEKLAAENGIQATETGWVALVFGLAIVVAVLGLLVFLVK